MDWKDIASAVAKFGLPMLGAALPIPGGAALGTALATSLGVTSGDPQDVLAELTASADARLRAQEFELAHQETMIKMQLDYQQQQYASEVADRDSARILQATSKAVTVPILAYVIVGAFIGMVACTLFGWTSVDSALAGTLVGYLSAKCEQVIAFYFGSSNSSERKTEMLYTAQKANETKLP